jgi:TrpR-related protein YerC/YecD
MAKAKRKERNLALYETIFSLKDLDECCRFFDDLCTPTELRSLEQRFDVAVYLEQGLVYLDILEKTGASSATISRVRRSMLDGGAGGVMEEVIKRQGLDKPRQEQEEESRDSE